MKNVIAVLTLAFASTFGVACATEAPKEAPKEKIVCIDKTTKDGKVILDKKTGKPAQDCRKMKIHKKLEGTKVPPK